VFDSAVRITHIPTKITATCNSERSQVRNKATALNLLKQKIDNLKYNEHLRKNDVNKKHASFGYQIRNYILFPYKLIKDVRTKVETKDIDIILEGNICIFNISFLLWKYL
jgi:peptide chain release factor 2